MTAWHSERQAIENMIERFGTGFFACVMDSYDYAEVRAAYMSVFINTSKGFSALWSGCFDLGVCCSGYAARSCPENWASA